MQGFLVCHALVILRQRTPKAPSPVVITHDIVTAEVLATWLGISPQAVAISAAAAWS